MSLSGHPARAVRRPIRTGFTLIELMTVITLVAILAALAAGGLRAAKTRAAVACARSELAALSLALEDYRRHHGDYPQLGAFAQAASLASADGPGRTTVQAHLFNALTGVFGPRAFTEADLLGAPNFLDVGRFSLGGALTGAFQVLRAAAPRPLFKLPQNVGLLDPWGRWYRYHYKNARNPGAWQAAGYVLYSAGPTVAADGDEAPPLSPLTGIFSATPSPEASDNLYATSP